MPSLTSFEFLIGEAIGSIVRNRLMALAAFLTAGVSLTISAGFAITALSVQRACEKLPQEFDMAVYLKRTTPPQQINAFGNKLKKMPNIASVTFISKEQGWKEFKKSLGAEISTEDVLYNPALDSFKLTMSKAEFSKSVEEKIAKMPEVDSVLWRQNEIRFFTGLSRVVAGAGALATVVLFLGSTLIIGNTIRLGIYARRHEVAIMRLVGATPWFIRFPFLLEGMIIAGAGAALAAVLIQAASSYLRTLTSEIQSVTRFFESGVTSWLLWLGLLSAGIVLGATASALSIRRYLKEGTSEGQQ